MCAQGERVSKWKPKADSNPEKAPFRSQTGGGVAEGRTGIRGQIAESVTADEPRSRAQAFLPSPSPSVGAGPCLTPGVQFSQTGVTGGRA